MRSWLNTGNKVLTAIVLPKRKACRCSSMGEMLGFNQIGAEIRHKSGEYEFRYAGIWGEISIYKIKLTSGVVDLLC
jgi:hypothetical protein